MGKVVSVLTGAGISAESGIPTFRDANGLWENYPVEEVASPMGFEKNPALVQRFYNERRHDYLTKGIEPNPAHRALAKLEREYLGDVAIITQNIDNLHERAGSKKVWHMHGELLKARCNSCGNLVECRENLTIEDVCEKCGHTGKMRPDVVWFGEMPFYMTEIDQRLKETDLFIAIGTSGVVYPAAGFVLTAKLNAAQAIEVNISKTEISPIFDRSIIGKASIEIPKLVEEILKG